MAWPDQCSGAMRERRLHRGREVCCGHPLEARAFLADNVVERLQLVAGGESPSRRIAAAQELIAVQWSGHGITKWMAGLQTCARTRSDTA